MPRKRKTALQLKLKALQDSLKLRNKEIAARLEINERTWKAWKYGENEPSPTGIRLINLLIEGKI